MNIYRHGECLLKEVELPKEAQFNKEEKKIIVAHSETGHHHVLEATKPMKVFTWNGNTYIEVPEIAQLWHDKTGSDVHTTHEIQPSVYKVILKKEFDYFAGLIRQVRD